MIFFPEGLAAGLCVGACIAGVIVTRAYRSEAAATAERVLYICRRCSEESW